MKAISRDRERERERFNYREEGKISGETEERD